MLLQYAMLGLNINTCLSYPISNIRTSFVFLYFYRLIYHVGEYFVGCTGWMSCPNFDSMARPAGLGGCIGLV